MTDDHYKNLIDHAREVALLESSAALLSWDQETMMPPGGIEHRARQLAQLARMAHELAVSPRFGETLCACEQDEALTADPRGVATVNIRELRRGYDRETKLPAELVAEIAETTSLAQHEWAHARRESDFARFQPWLEKLLGLARRKAECLGWGDGGAPIDPLIDGFEPGATARELEGVFAPLRQRLTLLLADVRDNGRPPSGRFTEQPLPIPGQEELVHFVVGQLGFDFERGRLDRSTHPFSMGVHCGDVRITTRYSEANMLDALGSAMHEAGHGMYEQGLAAEHAGTPMGSSVSLGVHESQSRLWENQVGRGRAFCTWCHTQVQRVFGDLVREYDADAVFGAANLVKPDFIRVEADEASYNLHVMVRFELELALLRGDLKAADVPAEWNRLYGEYLGLRVPDDRRGCLQDVHWSCGMFGYFPTYTLGNLYAAQFFAAAKREITDLEAQFARGEFAALKTWLNEKIHAHGQRYRAVELCEVVCGEPLSAEPFLRYLEGKVREVYRLG